MVVEILSQLFFAVTQMISTLAIGHLVDKQDFVIKSFGRPTLLRYLGGNVEVD
jgi:hypothetical protein